MKAIMIVLLSTLLLAPASVPGAEATVPEMVGHTGATQAKLYDNSLIDRLVQEGFIDALYKAGGR